jgi:N-acetylglucosaminyldiphosphoundecaprenol N-acetyl-beta-D-mannosaminyltransferase
LNICGYQHGYFDKSHSDPVIKEINAKRPDILFIGFGTPIQELWLDQHREDLNVPVCWTVGALVDFVSDTVSRGPRWMLDHNLEWLYRFVIEPRRMWRRYLIGNTRFLIAVFLQKFHCIRP